MSISRITANSNLYSAILAAASDLALRDFNLIRECFSTNLSPFAITIACR